MVGRFPNGRISPTSHHHLRGEASQNFKPYCLDLVSRGREMV